MRALAPSLSFGRSRIREQIPVPRRASLFLFLLALSLPNLSCDRDTAPKPSPPPGKAPTIASLVPSATDLIVAMGAEDHLVAVSNYDTDPQTARLPRVGDYQAIDWEKLAELKPAVIVSWYGPGKTPAGFVERTGELKIRDVNLRLNRLADVYDAVAVLGDAIDEPARAAAQSQRMRDAMAAVRRRVEGLPRVRAAIVTDASGLDFAGRGTYLDDLLEAAGGENAVTGAGYLTLDREAITATKPDVILQLLPGADPAAKAKNRAFWDAFPDLPAVKEHRVWQLTETYTMLPGSHVADVANLFATALHPLAGPAPVPATKAAAP